MLDEALREFRRVADLRPADASAPFFLGLIALRQTRWEDAVAAFRQAIEKGGHRAAALHNLGLALERLGRLEEADAAHGDAAGRARDDARVMLGWSVVALRRGEHQVAQGRLARARELAGGKPLPALWYWAATLASVGQDDAEGALRTAEEGATAHPSNPVLRNNLAVLRELAGDVAGAESLLRAALAEDPSLPQVSKNLADILYRNGRYEEARQAYERAAKLAPDLGDDLYFKLGNIAYKRRDHERARESWRRATELNPGHELARANLDMLNLAS
jgi:tetratricopeptide (TPR) repeat protein